jgi:hypothetical protein
MDPTAKAKVISGTIILGHGAWRTEIWRPMVKLASIGQYDTSNIRGVGCWLYDGSSHD